MSKEKSKMNAIDTKKIVSNMQEKFNYKNHLQVPRLLKVVVTMGVKDALVDSKAIDKALEDLFLIVGQKPVITKAKKAIAAFKLREGAPIGLKVTLRKQRMESFVWRLTHTALPRVKDFRGLSPRKFDGRGNYSVGLREHIVFPEINYDRVDKIRGMNIVFVTTAKTDEEAKALLIEYNFPFTN